jgi:DNA-binding LacI/PurR family transcriptional regulator
VEHDADAASIAAVELLSEPDRPTAIFAYSDVLASGALLAARQLALKVPQDVAVVGFDDTEIASALGLTTIRQPFEESGEVAFELLMASSALRGGVRETQFLSSR